MVRSPIAGEKDSQKKSEQQVPKREDQLAHLNDDIAAPASPAAGGGGVEPQPSTSGGSVATSSGAAVITREDSVMSVSAVSASLPPDTQKFLRFAGRWHF